MDNIKVGVLGKINEGDDIGDFVKIIDDSKNTGGYLILVSPSDSPAGEGYDDWVENWEDLEAYFKESKWVINWET